MDVVIYEGTLTPHMSTYFKAKAILGDGAKNTPMEGTFSFFLGGGNRLWKKWGDNTFSPGMGGRGCKSPDFKVLTIQLSLFALLVIQIIDIQ